MELKLDTWQKQVLATKGNLCICSGRQSGKSTVISIDAGEYALKHSNKNIMIIASVERQALLLFEKVLSYIYNKDKSQIRMGKDKGTKQTYTPTKHKLTLKNGTVINCLPTGDSGYGIRGYTIDRLYADEAHFINEDVWAAVTPMLATTGGDIILLSTPFGTTGYFHRCFYDKNFTSIHVNTEEVATNREEPQRTLMTEFLKDEKTRMTKLQYQQEYLGLFVGGIQRFFDDELIDKICLIKPNKAILGSLNEHVYGTEPQILKYNIIGDKFQGIDIARMGGDETVLVSGDRINKDRIVQFDLTIPEPQTLTDTARLIIHKDRQIEHKKIYMDDGGLGVGVYDLLYEDTQTKRKVEGLNNASREIEKTINHGKTKIRKKTLLGEDMSINFKNLAENGKITLFDDPRIRQSLKSMQCDYSDGKLKIYGNYSHIFEALKRAAYCMKDKTLSIMPFCK
ncbi:hypothetical protein LCGC14_1142960 [marine sediment metagenome]|uniref:Uncharacterized protein n=1 Tax=marine sediment metagenome TaxID=412755 RepID=A0A0F9Q3F1_9ZZZZ